MEKLAFDLNKMVTEIDTIIGKDNITSLPELTTYDFTMSERV
jgi:hypothetical protein